MKILYFGNQRLDAQNLATALRTVAKNGTVSWTSSLDRAAKWLDENRDVAALVVEAEADGATGASVLKHVRGLALRPALIVIVPEGGGTRLGPLAAAADDLIDKNSARFRDLPAIITRAVARLRGPAAPPAQPALTPQTPQASIAGRAVSAPESDDRADLERKLAQATAALQEAEHKYSAVSEQLAERQVKYDLASAQTTARWQMVDEQLRTAAIEAESARRSEAAAAAELNRLTQRERELTAQLTEASTSNDTLTRRVADVEAALETARTRAATEQAAAAEQLALRQRELQSQIAAEVDERRAIEGTLAQTIRDRDDAAARHSAAIDDAATELRERDTALRRSHDENAALTHKLADSEAALAAAHTRAAQEKAAAAEQLAARQREHESQLAAAAEERRCVEAALAQSVRAREEAETRRASAMMDAAAQLRELDAALRLARDSQASAAAEVERLTARETDLSVRLADVTTNHNTLERRLAATEAAFQDADTRATSERLEAARRAAAREAELDGQIRQERSKSAALETAVADTEAALRAAKQQHESTLEKAACELAEQQDKLSDTAADRDRIARMLANAEAALGQARADHRSATTEVERLTKREADLGSQVATVSSALADVQAAREKLEVELTDAGKAIENATAREKELENRFQQESAARASLERAVADGEAALHDTRQQHEAAIAKTAQELFERQAEFDRKQADAAAERGRLTEQVAHFEDALDKLRSDHQSVTADVARLTQREADLVAQLADGQSARQKLEITLADAIEKAASREAALDDELRAERSTNARLEQGLAAAETARRDAETQHEARLAAAAGDLASHQARFDRELSDAGAERDRLKARIAEVERALEKSRTDHKSARADVARLTKRETDLNTRIAAVESARKSLQEEMAGAVKALAEANEQATLDRTRAAQRETALESKLAGEIDARTTLSRTLDESRSAALAADQRAQHQADELRAAAREQKTAFEAALGQARAAADAEIARITAALEESGRALEKARSDSHTALELRDNDHAAVLSVRQGEIKQLHDKVTIIVAELEATKRILAGTRTEAAKLGPLQKDLEESRSESARLFQQAGLAMFRCSRGGEVTQTNRAGMTLVGRRTIDELRGNRFATAVFEDPNALSWLIERCVSSRTRESIETTWRRKDGGRLFVRLSAYASAADVIEIVAEDLTRVRVLQDRLGQAQRMEAVGRLASEVAVTCSNLIADVHHDVQQWLAGPGESGSSRQQGEHLLAELTRATGFLRQLAAYGDEQARTPAMADLNMVIRDLEPVLKRVAGDSVDVHVSDASSRLNVDVGTERIERLLVNLASFGRARMPHGGQLKIELGTTVVDRRFVAKHPNVRLGPHALITVTESRHTRKTDGLLQLRDTSPANRPAAEKPDQKPGMDFGTLQGLVGGCGGHLWMTVQPQGDMVAKIHLPLLTPFEQTAPRALALRGVRERALARLFHH